MIGSRIKSIVFYRSKWIENLRNVYVNYQDFWNLSFTSAVISFVILFLEFQFEIFDEWFFYVEVFLYPILLYVTFIQIMFLWRRFPTIWKNSRELFVPYFVLGRYSIIERIRRISPIPEGVSSKESINKAYLIRYKIIESSSHRIASKKVMKSDIAERFRKLFLQGKEAGDHYGLVLIRAICSDRLLFLHATIRKDCNVLGKETKISYPVIDMFELKEKKWKEWRDKGTIKILKEFYVNITIRDFMRWCKKEIDWGIYSCLEFGMKFMGIFRRPPIDRFTLCYRKLSFVLSIFFFLIFRLYFFYVPVVLLIIVCRYAASFINNTCRWYFCEVLWKSIFTMCNASQLILVLYLKFSLRCWFISFPFAIFAIFPTCVCCLVDVFSSGTCYWSLGVIGYVSVICFIEYFIHGRIFASLYPVINSLLYFIYVFGVPLVLLLVMFLTIRELFSLVPEVILRKLYSWKWKRFRRKYGKGILGKVNEKPISTKVAIMKGIENGIDPRKCVQLSDIQIKGVVDMGFGDLELEQMKEFDEVTLYGLKNTLTFDEAKLIKSKNDVDYLANGTLNINQVNNPQMTDFRKTLVEQGFSYEVALLLSPVQFDRTYHRIANPKIVFQNETVLYSLSRGQKLSTALAFHYHKYQKYQVDAMLDSKVPFKKLRLVTKIVYVGLKKGLSLKYSLKLSELNMEEGWIKKMGKYQLLGMLQYSLSPDQVRHKNFGEHTLDLLKEGKPYREAILKEPPRCIIL